MRGFFPVKDKASLKAQMSAAFHVHSGHRPKVGSLAEGRDAHECAQIIKGVPGVAIQLTV